MRHAWLTGALGAACFLALHVLFVLTWDPWFRPAARLDVAWFLGSRPSIVLTQITLGVAALAITARPASSWRSRFVTAAWFLAGVMTAMIATFMVLGAERLMLGPTRLWPWVLFSTALLLGPAVLAGTLLGGILRRPGGH